MFKKDLAALTPPMGWNSWDSYGASVNEKQLLENAKVMRDQLLPFGYEYVVCDIQWSEPTADSTEYHPFARLTMDTYGRLLPAYNRFPSGFQEIAETIHNMGLKFGIHIMRGIPRQAVYSDFPIKGTRYTAREIVLPFRECRWNTDMYALNPAHPGAQAYYDSIFELYSEWGVDYIKADDILRTDYDPNNSYAARADIEMIRSAIDKTGREMVLSLSPGPAKTDSAWHLSKHANMWRITDDLWDEWPLVHNMFDRMEAWQAYVKPGCWPDADMLPLGTLRMWKGGIPSNLSKDEQITLMSLWCIFRAPLMMGGELTRLDAFTKSILTNREILSLTKSEHAARQVERTDAYAVWTNLDTEGNPVAALFNTSDRLIRISVPFADITESPVLSLTDLWTGDDIPFAENAISFEIRPHASRVVRLKG
ncbi:MAG: glycoside hydrolase family 27 protein [Clostridia bacterium]|nr:glycoside hydrolase family 27 protein [Clostridia bacterium]MBQ4158250.1 glycoside hydrolase family 27 protein [Clostridia bacterium]